MIQKSEISRKVKQFHLISRKLVDSLFAGNYHSVFKGPGLEFHDVREYMPGDDARFIDWNVSSRMNVPYLKTFREEREMLLQIIVDVSSSLRIGTGENTKLDIAGIVFALLGFAAVANNDRIGSILFSDKIESVISPMKGKKHVLRQISTLLSSSFEGKGSHLAQALRTGAENMKRRGIVVILSDFKITGFWKELSLLARRHDVLAIRITDPLDWQFPGTGLIDLEDSETGEGITIYGSSRKFRKEYEDFWELQRINWINGCRQCGVDTLEISTEDEPAKKLLQFFERRKKK